MTFGATDSGWYSASGFHDPDNNNYFAGYSASSAAEFRNWFVFDLPVFTAPVASATLRLATFDARFSSNAIFELHHVSTSLAMLTNGGSGLTNIFGDLGDGAVFGTGVVSGGQGNSFISIPLNSNALATISSSFGQRFAIGGRLASLLPGSTNDHTLFGYSYGSQTNVQLTLAFGSTSAPVLLSQPPAEYLIPAGDFARFDVTACGATPLIYRWFQNGSLLPGQTSAALAINNVASTNSGDYFVIVSNSFGAVTSSVTHMIVDARPATLESLDYAGQVLLGNTIRISAKARGIPTPSIRWFYGGLPLPSATNSDLRIPNAQIAYSGIYTLIVSNAYGSVTRDIQITVLPFVIDGPDDSTIALGADTFLSSGVEAAFTPTFQWRFNGTNLPGANTRVLPLFNPSAANAGSYDLVVSGGGYAQTSRVAAVSVAGLAPHLIWYAPSPVFEGNSVMLEHFVSGSPPIRLQWFFRSALLPGATNAHLAFNSASTNDAGAYLMVASNAFGITSNQLFLTVSPQPATGPSAALARSGYTGENILLDSRLTGGPVPVWQWQVNGTNIPGATNSSLILSNASLDQSGAYFCRGTNIYGASTGQVNVMVLPRRGLDTWAPRDSLPHANDLDHIAFHNGRYVAVGQGGSIVTSTNAIDWTSTELGNRFTAVGLAAGNGRFAALIVEDGNYFVLTSSDGLDWTPNVVPGFASLTAISFEEGNFHVWGTPLSGLSRRAESGDGATWRSDFTSGLGTAPRTASHGAGTYVVAGYGRVFDSADGLHFNSEPAPAAFFNRVRSANGIFVAVGSSGALFTSTDAKQWQPRYSEARGQLHGIAYGAGRFLVVGENGAVLASTDNGATWSLGNGGVTQHLKDILFDGAQFVVCGNDGVLLTSTDGTVWTNHRRGNAKALHGVSYTNGLFVAVGDKGTILTSGDGVDWTQQLSPIFRDLRGITYAAGQFIAVGSQGTVLSSVNGTTWTNRTAPTTNSLMGAAYGLGRYVVVGSPPSIIGSTNGIDWESHPVSLPSNAELHDVAFGQGTFFAVGGYLDSDDTPHPLLLFSTNGTSWSLLQNSPGVPPVFLRGVAFGRTNFLVVGDGGTIVHLNGTNALASVASLKDLQQVRFAAGRFIVVGSGGEVASVTQSGQWNEHASIVSEKLRDITFGANKFVAVGDAGTIVQSDDALPTLSTPRTFGNLVQFDLRGGVEPLYRIESSANLSSWVTFGFFTNNGTASVFTDVRAPFRFYRAVSP